MAKKKKTAPSARSKAKYPALNTSFMPKVRREFFDFDYINQLSEKEKAWLNKFVEEELNASFKNDSRDLNKSKKDKRRVYHNNNARNRDLFAISKANGLLSPTGDVQGSDIVNNPELTEDALISRIDDKNKKD